MSVVDHAVTEGNQGGRTALRGQVLEFDAETVRGMALQDNRIARVDSTGVYPGVNVTLVQVLDCVSPVCAGDGGPASARAFCAHPTP